MSKNTSKNTSAGAGAPKLGSPLGLPCGATLPNRFMKSAMSEVMGGRRFEPTDRLANLYRVWSEGGTGLLVSGNVMVDRRHRGEPSNVVVEDESNLDALRAWAKAGTSRGNHFWMQINHPGKQTPSLLTPEPVSPSAVALKIPGFARPRALEESEIWDIVGRFATAAAVAKKAGFTGVQIHGAHGYLVSQFLSPHHNRRGDQWGGSLENRTRFALEVYKAIRAAVGPGFPVGIKLNSADFQNGGFSEEDCLSVVSALTGVGVDLVEISGGTYEAPAMMGRKAPESVRRREAYFLEFAEKVRGVTRAPLAVTGGFRSARGMADALASGAADVVGLARPLALTPDIPNRVLAGEDFVSPVRPFITSGVKAVDKLFMLDITWYEQQLKRIGRGQAPNPNLSPWLAGLNVLRDNGLAAIQPRRA